MSCPACGAAVPEGARFCPSCGRSLRARADERRVVTVLFADLVGYTALSETMDPEQVKNLVDQCFEQLVVDVTSFGGQVDKIVGDAIVALFGAPVAHEDDAERAVRAALRMQETLATQAVERAGTAGGMVQMRIGINTGEVLVGALRAGGDYTAMGDVVNTASRLQTAASPGEILVGPSTHAATRNVIRYEQLGPLQARNRDEPVEAYRAVEAIAPPGYRPRRLRVPIVGRDAELGMLAHAIDAAVERRRAQLVLLVGEAGVGKSRLAEELAARAECDHDAALLEGRCVPYGEANVWWPLADALRRGFGIEPSDLDEEAERKIRSAVGAVVTSDPTGGEGDRVAEGLAHLMGVEGGRLADIERSRAREEATRSLRVFLEAYASTRPVVLVLSDLHWADDTVLEVLDHVVEHLCPYPFVLVATTRRVLEERWIPKPGRHNSIVLNVDALDRTATSRLLAALMEGDPPAEVSDLLLDRSGGNPLFLEELVSLLAESPAGDDEPGTRKALPPAAILELPDTLRGLVAARIDGLTAAERSTLEDAAVLGHDGPLYALNVMAEHRGHRDAMSPIRGLIEKEILQADDKHWSFRSDVIREVAYNTLTKGERARRHAGVATWVASHKAEQGPGDEYVERAARHFACAAELVAELGAVEGLPRGFEEQARDWIERAAVRAEVDERFGTAENFYDQGLQLQVPGTAEHRAFLLGRARSRTGKRKFAGAHADVMTLLEDASSAGDDRTYAAAVTVLGEVQQKEGEVEAAAATLERAIGLWRAVGDRGGAANALRLLGLTHIFRNDQAAASKVLNEALEAFVEVGDRRGEAWALQHLAWVAYFSGRADEAEQNLNRAIQVFNDLGDAGGLSWALGLMGFVMFHQGRFDEAESLASTLIDETADRGDRWAHGMLSVLLGSLRLWRGSATEGERWGEEAVRSFRAISDRWGEVQALCLRGRSLLALGRIDDAMAVLDEAGADGSDAQGGALAFTAIVAAAAAVELGEPARALEMLEPIRANAEGNAIGFADLMVASGLAQLQLGEVDAALEVLTRANDAGEGRGYPGAALAQALAAAGRVDEAVEMASGVVEGRSVTYLDRVMATVASGLAHARAGRAIQSGEAFADALGAADRTDDRVAQALVRLARTFALEALDDPEAAEARVEADARLDELGIEPSGWVTVYQRSAHGDRAPDPASA